MWESQWAPGPALERICWVSETSAGDSYFNAKVRFSSDNGQSWSLFTALPPSAVTYAGVTVTEEELYSVYDPVSSKLIQPWIRIHRYGTQTMVHAYYRLSSDSGRTWTTPKMLRYEEGPEFNPSDPNNLSHLNTNTASYGQTFIATSTGNVLLGVDQVNDPNDPLNDTRDRRLAARNFVGTWNSTTQDYDWQAGTQVAMSIATSSRGLLETDVAELKDGRILDVWRGSNYGILPTPGRKWFSVSSDGGLTLSPVAELKYDDGTQFYSPSSQDRLVRNTGNGKLYWIGNISPTNPDGNSPRYPLVIAEVDEDLVALKKDTVTLVATKLSSETTSVQYSNFSVLENPQTHQFEIFLTNIGAASATGSAFWNADALKFTLTFPEELYVPGDANRDGQVDNSDAMILVSNWQTLIGATWAMGDFNDDNKVDDADATLLAANWQFGVSNSNSVPEPGAIALLISAVVGLLIVRRKR